MLLLFLLHLFLLLLLLILLSSPFSLLPSPSSLQTMNTAFWLLVLQMSCTDLRRQRHPSLLLLLIRSQDDKAKQAKFTDSHGKLFVGAALTRRRRLRFCKSSYGSHHAMLPLRGCGEYYIILSKTPAACQRRTHKQFAIGICELCLL